VNEILMQGFFNRQKSQVVTASCRFLSRRVSFLNVLLTQKGAYSRHPHA